MLSWSEERKKIRIKKLVAFLTAIMLALVIVFFLSALIIQLWPVQEKTNFNNQATERDSVIGDIKTIYAEIYNPATNEAREPYLLKTSPEDIYQSAVLYFDRFSRLEKAFSFLAPGQNPNDLPETLWQQIGIPKKNGDILFWYTGQQAAQALFLLAKNPPKTNNLQLLIAPFIDKAEIMAHVQIILADINVSPNEIGASDNEIKKIALADLVQQIQKVRQDIKAKHLNRKNGLRAILALAKRGIDHWHFNPKDLGLTNKETLMLMPLRRHTYV